jgi:dimethylargininase
VRIALTRAVSPRIVQCELGFIARQPIDFARAAAQHLEYERRLAAHGYAVMPIAGAPEFPDGVFVEDCAIVLDEVAIITRPGAASRQGETESVAAALESYRTLRRIKAPGTLDGGDVFRIGRKLYVGRSQRTNEEGIVNLRLILADFGYRVVPVDFHDCLHLKSAVTQIGERAVLVNPEWVDVKQFRSVDAVAVDGHEPSAANALRIDDALFHSASYPKTRHILESRGYNVEPIDVSELEKAEAGVTCCSLIFEA